MGAVIPFHGGLNPLRAVRTDKVHPHVLIQSGGIDDAHGNTTELEMQLDGAGATWEITRYSNTPHGFTKWGSGRYDAMADSRSWDSMMTLFADMENMAAEPVLTAEEKPSGAPVAMEMVEEEAVEEEAVEEEETVEEEAVEEETKSHD